MLQLSAFWEQAGFRGTTSGLLALGLLLTIYMLLSIFNFAYAIVEHIFFSGFANETFYVVLTLLLGLQYYFTLVSANAVCS